jgi:hypothetical protein
MLQKYSFQRRMSYEYVLYMAKFNLKCKFKKCVKMIHSPDNLQGKIWLI